MAKTDDFSDGQFVKKFFTKSYYVAKNRLVFTCRFLLFV